MSKNSRQSSWDPMSTKSWAETLGLVYVPMFSNQRSSHHVGDHAVLLDGLKGSFALSSSDKSLNDHEPLEWSWSSNLRHTVFLTENNVFVKRWDSPDNAVISKRRPNHPAGIIELLNEIETARSNRLPDVISRMLKAFRAIRANLSPYSTNTVDYIRLFNALLLGSEQARIGKIDPVEWSSSNTISQALALLQEPTFEEISSEVGNLSVEHLLDFFLEPDPNTNYILEPDLLIRHAAGQLYQEAHFEIEREAIRQLPFPSMASDTNSKGTVKRDARFTPPSLARTIVEQSFDALFASHKLPTTLSILDPACGSGVFLQEALRQLLNMQYKGKVRLSGFDTSEVSCTITKFCLERVADEARDSGINVEMQIVRRDALEGDWGKHDFIFMNPPFLNWERLSDDDRDAVKIILDKLFSGRADIAMAFLWRATQSLSEGGCLGSILPSPMLNSNSAAKLREGIAQAMHLSLIGTFKGYNYFPGAMVEPAFIVLRKNDENNIRQTVKILTAQEGMEDRALRLLRRGDEEIYPQTGVEILRENIHDIDKINWLPKTRTQVELLSKLSTANSPKVRDLFTVHQGIRTGNNGVFVLSQHKLHELPEREQAYFKPLAGTKTISGATISVEQYVFYPYGSAGLLLTTEDQLKKELPYYYQIYLEPAKLNLGARAGIEKEIWWILTRERSWQWTQSAKFVTKAFGKAGSFALDQKGQFVVGQGYAWIWKTSPSHISGSDFDENNASDDVRDNFHESPLPWAYLSLLNSSVFERLLSLYCTQVAGGQFDLSNKYVETIDLPDLLDNNRISNELVEKLANMGRMIDQGLLVSAKDLSETAAKAYGIPLSEWTAS